MRSIFLAGHAGRYNVLNQVGRPRCTLLTRDVAAHLACSRNNYCLGTSKQLSACLAAGSVHKAGGGRSNAQGLCNWPV